MRAMQRGSARVAKARGLRPAALGLRPPGLFTASSPIAQEPTHGSLLATLLDSCTESSNEVQRHVGGLQVKVDLLKEMSEKQTSCQKASAESLEQTMVDMRQELEKQTDDQKASAETLEKLVSDSAARFHILKDGHAGLSDEMVEVREQLFEHRKERFHLQEIVSDTQTFTRSAFASIAVPAVLICGFGGHLIVTGMSNGLFLPSAITLDIAKDIAKAFSGLALTFGSCAGITFNTCKYFAKADKTERAMHRRTGRKSIEEKNGCASSSRRCTARKSRSARRRTPIKSGRLNGPVARRDRKKESQENRPHGLSSCSCL